MELKITKSRTFIKLEDLKFDDVSLMGKHHCLAVEDLRRGYFFLFLVLTAFFGTGNIASINTFEPSSVYCFLTVFRPFTMGGLMMWKILIPILLVTCTFTALHVVLQVSTQSLLLMVLLISDFMAIHFFFLVREDGSWLEIGTSISHYVIVMCMIIFVLILLAVSKIFTSFTIKIPFSRKHHIAVWKID